MIQKTTKDCFFFYVGSLGSYIWEINYDWKKDRPWQHKIFKKKFTQNFEDTQGEKQTQNHSEKEKQLLAREPLNVLFVWTKSDKGVVFSQERIRKVRFKTNFLQY